MNYTKEAGIDHSILPHKLRHFLFTWMKKKGVDDTLIQPYSGHDSRQSLEIYSKLSLGDCQPEYEKRLKIFQFDPIMFQMLSFLTLVHTRLFKTSTSYLELLVPSLLDKF